MTSVQKILKLQRNPDGEEGHEERKQIQKASMRFPKKKKYTGGAKHYYTRKQPPSNTETQIEEMKANCLAYEIGCKHYQCCELCQKRDKANELLLIHAKEVIYGLEDALKKKGCDT